MQKNVFAAAYFTYFFGFASFMSKAYSSVSAKE